ncbi:RNA polymerase sigma factor [Confluentibacter sediminis]|uniref:RNA polymerase sigma factor n=1 Tax=Confluentibacter sediminis TaxID=2219045 RepID=UPI000DABC34A|nr:sigma-70 family RNA polymerase sigma factor [Confluentibacter sediminis]
MSKKEKEHIISHTVSKYGEKLMTFIKPKVRSSEDAEDILQEVWFQLSNLTNISDIVNISSWLFSVTRNKITDNYRKKKTKNLEDYSFEDDSETFIIKDILLIDSASPELKLFQDDIWQALLNALDELPEKQRKVYVENEFNNKTLQQIADDEGENVKTIISRKTYAIRHLRLKLNLLYQDLNND